MLQIGLIGTGYWGPNIARSLELTGKAEIRWLCDLDSSRSRHWTKCAHKRALRLISPFLFRLGLLSL